MLLYRDPFLESKLRKNDYVIVLPSLRLKIVVSFGASQTWLPIQYLTYDDRLPLAKVISLEHSSYFSLSDYMFLQHSCHVFYLKVKRTLVNTTSNSTSLPPGTQFSLCHFPDMPGCLPVTHGTLSCKVHLNQILLHIYLLQLLSEDALHVHITEKRGCLDRETSVRGLDWGDIVTLPLTWAGGMEFHGSSSQIILRIWFGRSGGHYTGLWLELLWSLKWSACSVWRCIRGS
jgi:hypothetical protein